MKLLSLAAAAEQCSVSNMTIRRMIKTGQLKHVRIGRCLRVVAEDVDKVVASRISVGQ
jgi:excisionase family DNA binding protein